MSTRKTPAGGGCPGRAGWLAAVAAVALAAAAGKAQSPTVAPLGPPGSGEGLAGLIPAVDTGMGIGTVTPAGCASCGSLPGSPGYGPGVLGYGHRPAAGCGLDGPGGEGCGENGCVPGREPVPTCCEGQGRVGRIFCGLQKAVCSPDPCYEPKWICPANAALFVDYARPATVTRFRWDSGNNLTQPDRAEYFWAAIGGKGPRRPETRVNYNELRIYQEAATEKFSFYIDLPYRNQNGAVNGGSGGFGDLILGTKSVLFDSELAVLSFQFATSIPTASPARGVGVGHVTLDPSLLATVKLYPDTYWQSQLGYTIPLGGTRGFQGSVLHYANSLNHVLCRPVQSVSFVGSIESVGYTFTAGSFTDANGAVRSANGQTYFGVGPGFRMCVCDKLDVGFGMLFSVTSNHFAEQLYRTELRYRY